MHGQVNAHSGQGADSIQPDSLQNEHNHSVGQRSNAHSGHDSNISYPVLFPGTPEIRQDKIQQPMNAHSGHGLNPQQPVSMLSEHSLGAGQLSSTHRGHGSDISNPVPFPGTNVNSQSTCNDR